MTVQDHGNAIHAPTRMPLDESEFAQVQWAGRLVAQYRRDFSVYTVRTRQLAGHDRATAAGGVAQADGMGHGYRPGMRNRKGSTPWVCWFFALRASSGGRIICTVVLPSLPEYTTALTPPSR